MSRHKKKKHFKNKNRIADAEPLSREKRVK